MRGERRFRRLHEAVGLVPVKPALDRHHASGGDVAGSDREHRVVSFLKDGSDVADEQLAVGVPAVDLAKEPIEALDGQVASNSEVLEDQADLGQTQIGSTQQADELACTDLTGVVAPISAGLINARGAKKSDPVIDPERLRRQTRAARERTDREESLCCVTGHAQILVIAPGEESSRRVDARSELLDSGKETPYARSRGEPREPAAGDDVAPPSRLRAGEPQVARVLSRDTCSVAVAVITPTVTRVP